MNGWRGWGDEEGGPDPRKISFAIGAGLGALVLCWMVFARSGEENVSSNGFSDGGAGVAPASFSFERRKQTGLSMVSGAVAAAPSSVKTEAVPGSASGAAPAAAPPAAAVRAPVAVVSETSGAVAPPDTKEMAAAGVPTDPAGLMKIGGDVGLLTNAISRLLDHPRILRALLDNTTVVNALMDREDARRACSDAGALQAGLSSPGAGAYEMKMMPLVSAALARPDAVTALAGSQMGARMMACPSAQALARNPAGLMAIAAANPQVVSMVSDPRVAQALASTSEGTSLVGGVQSSIGSSNSAGSAP